MKKLLLAFGMLSLSVLAVFGQTSKSDLEQLRKQVGLPSTVLISENRDFFPDLKPIKIYLAIKHNKSAAKDFTNWVNEWNRTNGNQYGRLQLVNNLNEADVAAVQYYFGISKNVREESLTMKIGSAKADNNTDDKFVLGRVGNSPVRAESSVRTLQKPLYTYLMVRDGQNPSWFVNYARVNESISNKVTFPERLLQSAVENRLKNR